MAELISEIWSGLRDAGLPEVMLYLADGTASRCHWLEALGLEEHYARAELEAALADDGSVAVKEPVNVTRFAILPPVLQAPTLRLRLRERRRSRAGLTLVRPTRDRYLPIRAGGAVGSWRQTPGAAEAAVPTGSRPQPSPYNSRAWLDARDRD